MRIKMETMFNCQEKVLVIGDPCEYEIINIKLKVLSADRHEIVYNLRSIENNNHIRTAKEGEVFNGNVKMA